VGETEMWLVFRDKSVPIYHKLNPFFWIIYYGSLAIASATITFVYKTSEEILKQNKEIKNLIDEHMGKVK
jgi:hypothetical protein